MKQLDVLKKELQSWSGSVLGFGVDESLKEIITKNEQITVCNLLDLSGQGKGAKGGTTKEQVAVKKLKKRFSKKNHTYLLANYETIAPYKKTFVRDSIYLTKHLICISLPANIDETHLVKMYERYATVDVQKIEDGILLWIDVEGKKTNFLLDKLYYVGDSFFELFEVISELMIG